MNMIEIWTCRSQESRWARILKMMWRQPRSARSATTSTILLTPVVIVKLIWSDHFCPSSMFTRQRCCHRFNGLKITKARHFLCTATPTSFDSKCVLFCYSCLLTLFKELTLFLSCCSQDRHVLNDQARSPHSRLTRQNAKSLSRLATGLHLKIRSTWAQDIVESGAKSKTYQINLRILLMLCHCKKVFDISFNVGFYQGFKFFRQDFGINLQKKTFFLFLSLVVKFPATWATAAAERPSCD